MKAWLPRLRAIALAVIATTASPPGFSDAEAQGDRQASLPTPVDHPFDGTIALSVDATDVAHKVFTVRLRIPVQRSGPLVLLYPRWERASHGPTLTVANLAGLTVDADGRALRWRRDPLEPHAFHIDVPDGAKVLQARYQIMAATGELTPRVVVLPWQKLILYPAGWFARDLPVAASARIPVGLTPFTSLERSLSSDGHIGFTTTALDELLDAPVFAARESIRIPLSKGASAVTLDLLFEGKGRPEIPSPRVAELTRMVAQARLVFGPAPFRHYNFITRMSDDGSTGGTEHRASSEIAVPSDYFGSWDRQLINRDILPHEFAHAWNGMYRTPADLWAPTPNLALSGSLLWVYEGQAEFWGRILSARSGIRTRQETLDRLALDAAEISHRPGRSWRPLSDDVAYPSFMLRQPVPWDDWQRRKDYYEEGVLLWLAVEARMRERSGGRRGIDDFAGRFFAGATADAPTRVYTFETLCADLEGIVPGNWTTFLRDWIDAHAELDTLQGLEALGWQLTFSDTPTETFRQHEVDIEATDLRYSIGITIDADGRVASVAWNSPAFSAGLAPRTRIIAVTGRPFSLTALLDAVRNSVRAPVILTVEQDGERADRALHYAGGLRYPRLERISNRADKLRSLLTARR